MGKKKFDKKGTVRFTLVPGKDENGNPVNLFKPVDTNTRVAPQNRDKLISTVSDYQIEIDGKPVDESEIPNFILEQIRGRADLVFNQKHVEMLEQEEYMEQDMGEMQEGEGEEEWEDEQEQEQVVQELQDYTFEGKTYKMTRQQIAMLEEVMPENYDDYQIEGVEFTKFDQDGNRIDRKKTFEKYLAEPEEKVTVIDSYEYVPEKPLIVVDNDLKEEQMTGEMREIEAALNYDEDDNAYEELQDDFFVQLMSNNAPKPKAPAKPSADSFKKKKKPVPEPVQSKQYDHDDKWDDIDEEEMEEGDYEQMQEGQGELTDDMVDRALQEFDRMTEAKHDGVSSGIEHKSGEGLIGMALIKFIESREECMGRDGELDWRTLTKKEKKDYMKNKKIRSYFQELREREIEQKMRNISNVAVEDLHLKQHVEHLSFQQDHVIQDAIKREEEGTGQESESDSYETDSDEDDIISYRAKTSVISSNLACVEEMPKIKKSHKASSNDLEESLSKEEQERVRVIGQTRKRGETKEQRKERKEKLKNMKKAKREQKKKFGQKFEDEEKKVKKGGSGMAKDPLHRVSYVKII